MPDSSSDQPPQVTSSQIYSQPLSPPESFAAPIHKSNSPVVKAVLIVVAIFVGLGVIGVGVVGFGVWYLAKSVHAVPSATFTERDLGIAIYPGAEPSLTGSRVEIGGRTVVSAVYFTRDSVDQVIAFYKDKAGITAHFLTTAHGSEFRLSAGLGNTTTVGIMRIPDASGGKTRIHIRHATQTAAPH